MILLAIIPLIGVGLLFLAVVVILHRSSAQRQFARADIDGEVQDKLKKAKALDTKFAHDVLGGCDMDAAIDAFQRARAGIFAIPSDSPWVWDVDELQKWAKEQLATQATAINGKARLVALSVIIVIALVIIGIDATLYSTLSASQPMLSPLGPAQQSSSPTPLPVPSPAVPTSIP